MLDVIIINMFISVNCSPPKMQEFVTLLQMVSDTGVSLPVDKRKK
ncbi:hypothetical protein [Clostridium polyendosporum]|nr:hypothetical protein [Clostridium polyendosporum]